MWSGRNLEKKVLYKEPGVMDETCHSTRENPPNKENTLCKTRRVDLN